MAARTISKSHDLQHAKSPSRGAKSDTLRAREFKWRVSVNLNTAEGKIAEELFVFAPSENVARTVGLLHVLNESFDLACAYLLGDSDSHVQAVQV